MNKQEFESWKKETERSNHQWVIDLINNGRDGQDLLTFKGGVNGSYFEISQTGLVTMGTYEGAVPCITDALFTVKGTHQCKSFEDAETRLIGAIGSRFLLEFIGVR